jgi:hypothetical protein
MAISKIQLDVEEWIRDKALPSLYGQTFHPGALKLKSGGVFNFDAISEDCCIVANISTSGARTARRKHASGKIQKIRADMLFLLMASAEKRLIVLTERDMFDFWEAEKQAGRVPLEIEFIRIKLPTELSIALENAKRTASEEVSPQIMGDKIQTLIGPTAVDSENDQCVSE